MTINYTLELDEPLLATSPAGDVQTERSYWYVPGSAIRGALASRYLRSARNADAAADPLFRTLFLEGTVRYLNAYPVRNAGIAYPTPRSWKRVAGEPSRMVDLAFSAGSEGQPPKLESVREPGCVALELRGETVLVTPDHRLRIHVQRDRRLGRSVEASGALFQYDALARGQRFSGSIRIDDPDHAGRVSKLLEESPVLFLGGSRGAGYGRVRVRSESPSRERPREWPTNNRAVVVLNSPALLTDSFQDNTTSARSVGMALSSHLGVGVSIDRAYMRTETVGGFNAAWGFPLMQQRAISAGSTFVCTLDQDAAPGDWEAATYAGIGARRAEGFGAFRVTSSGPSEWTVQEKDHAGLVSVPRPDLVGAEARALADRVVRGVFERRLDEALRRKARELAAEVGSGVSKGKGPSRSQLGTVRSVVLQALSVEAEEGRRLLRTQLASIRSRTKFKDRFSSLRIGGTPLLDWLQDRADDKATALDQGVWKMFGGLHKKNPTVGGVTASITADDSFRCGLRLTGEMLRLAGRTDQ